jgi:UDP-2,3-diacylglucosamine pyrophosphatase LpxH
MNAKNAALDGSTANPQKLQFTTVWLSDIHLGFKDCKADYLNHFLESIDCKTLYLVGDVIDLWSMKKQFFWHKSHYQVLQNIQNMANSGTKVIYIPGNHDETFRQYVNQNFMNIEVHRQYIHRTCDGRRFLLVHGDEFDSATRYNRIIHIIGDAAYTFLLFLNRWHNRLRRIYKGHYWSLASFLKNKISKARAAIHAFEHAAAHEAKRQGVDGIICGHIHQPAIKKIDNILYCNDGDWIENCTALVENTEGYIELIHWSDIRKTLKVNNEITKAVEIS